MNKSVLKINYNPPKFSLQEKCLIRIITTLCNNRQLLGLILKCEFYDDVPSRLMIRHERRWKDVLAKASELVSKICSSALIQRRLLEFLWPVSHRILWWKFVYAPHISNRFLLCFYWTDRGRIDTKRTAKHMTRNKSIPARKRFILASNVCLVKETEILWSELSPADIRYFLNDDKEKTAPLFEFWAQNLSGSFEDLEECMDTALTCATHFGMLDAVKCLSSICRDHGFDYQTFEYFPHLIESFMNQNHLEEDGNDTAHLMFLEMPDNLQEIFFREKTELVLSLLLHASNYELCFKLLEERLPSKSAQDYSRYLKIIFFNYHLEISTDEGCRKLFVDVWRMLPTSMKNSIISSDLRAVFPVLLLRDNFPFLLERRALRTLKLINSTDINSGCSMHQMKCHEGKWELLLFFIEEEITTIAWMTKYKKDILDQMSKTYYHQGTLIRILSIIRYLKCQNNAATVTE